MKKKLIVLAIVGAFAMSMVTASVYGANVTLFGSLQAEYATVNREGQSNQTLIGDETYRSKFGAHVTENLGGGFKVKTHLEFGLNAGGESHGTRERWVALAEDKWGEVKFGRVQSPFKDFAGGMTIDPFAYTALQAAGSGGTMIASVNGFGSGAMGFVSSAIRYDSPKVDGFSFAGLLMPGDSDRLNPVSSGNFPGSIASAGGEDGEWDFQIAGKYETNMKGNNFTVFGAYSRDNVSTRQRWIQGLTFRDHLDSRLYSFVMAYQAAREK